MPENRSSRCQIPWCCAQPRQQWVRPFRITPYLDCTTLPLRPSTLLNLCRLLPAESVLAPLLPEDTSKLPDWTLLVLFLAEQRHNLDRHLPVSPTWQPYLQRLPGHPVGTILDWPAEEVGERSLGWATM